MRLLIVSLLAASIVRVSSVIVSARRSSRCALLSKKIYCYGGILSNKDDILDPTSDLFSLDVYDGNNSNNTYDSWTLVHSAINSELANPQRCYPQFASHPDGNSLLINGGITFGSNLQSNTIIYNAMTNSWEAVDGYPDNRNGGERQINVGTVVYVPGNESYYFYGGQQWSAKGDINAWYYDAPSATNFTGLPEPNDSTNNTMYLGYYRATSLALNARTDIWDPLSIQTNIPKIGYYHQTAVYHPKSRIIYYFGGNYIDLLQYIDEFSQSFAESIIFNTISASWGKQAFGGQVPLKRMFHSTTLLPSMNDILLYGGTDGTFVALNDYCYTVNLEDFTWVHHNYLKLPDGNSGARSEHAAVLVENNLFILFGYNKGNNLTNSVLILDISNPSNLTFKSSWLTVLKNEDITTSNSTSNKGVIIGAAVGGSIGGILILAAILFYTMKKKKPEPIEEKKEDQMSVDWDAIEGRFTETHLAPPDDSQGHAAHNVTGYQHPDEVPTMHPGLQQSPSTTSATAVSPSISAMHTKDARQSITTPDVLTQGVNKPDVAL